MFKFSSIINSIQYGIKNKQIVSLLTWNVLNIPLSFIINILITNLLGSELYGDYMYLNSLFNVGIIIINLGFFQAGNRAIVISKSEQQINELYGAQLVVLIFLYILLTIVLFLNYIFDQNLLEKNLNTIYFYFIPFGFVFLLSQYFETLLMADNRIDKLVITRYIPKIIFLVLLFIYYFFSLHTRLNPINRILLVWYSLIISQIIIYFIVLFNIHLSFNHLFDKVKFIINVNKTFGIHVYFGNLLSTLFMQLSPIIISYFSLNNKGVGYYTLSVTLSSPLSFIPAIIATTHYKEFTNYNKIPKRLLFLTFSLSCILLFTLWAIVPIFVYYFYNPDFMRSVDLFYFTSIGVFLYGVSDFFSRFLSANGYGVALRNSSIIVGFTTLCTNVITVKYFGEIGAAYSYLLAGIVYISTILFYYNKFQKS